MPSDCLRDCFLGIPLEQSAKTVQQNLCSETVEHDEHDDGGDDGVQQPVRARYSFKVPC